MGIYAGLSDTDLPQPVVLVVGDASSFSDEVWTGVAAASTPGVIEWTELEPLLELAYPKLTARLNKRGWGWVPRPKTRVPVPLQLTHRPKPDPKQLHAQLRIILDCFDVWGIVASASASEVNPLRTALRGVDIPLLVTTDSTTVSADDELPNELRLMPSNKAQASTMLFHAAQVNDVYLKKPPTGVLRRPPEICYAGEQTAHAHAYVEDLEKQLLREAQRQGVRLASLEKGEDRPGPVIGLGYQKQAEELMKSRAENRLTILSDGCATEKVYKAVRAQRADDRQYWYVTRSQVPLEEAGSVSFTAIAEAARQRLTWEPHTSTESERPETSMRDEIKKILEDTNKDYFRFDGAENVAPAYRVEPISQQTDLVQMPPPKDLDDPADGPKPSQDGPKPSQHLRVVS